MRSIVAYVLALGIGGAFIAFAGLVVAGNLRGSVDRANLGWAVVDRNAQPIGDLRFDEAQAFSEGLAAVEVGGVWGYVDTGGRWVIEPRYSRTGAFDASGLAVAEEGARAGLVNRAGAWVVQPTWKRIGRVSDGVAVVVDSVGFRTSSVSRAEPELSAGLIRVEDGAVIVTPAGVESPTRWTSARGPSEGLLAVERVDGWHLANLRGDVVTELGLEDLREFHDGLAAATRSGVWGYLATDGRFAVAPRWKYAGPFAGGRAPVEGSDGWRVVSPDGAPVGENVFGLLHAFSEGFAPAMDAEGRWGFVDRDAGWALSPQWAAVGEEGFQSGRARVARAAGLDYEWAWIDVEGRVVGDRWFAALQPFNGEHALARIPR